MGSRVIEQEATREHMKAELIAACHRATLNRQEAGRKARLDAHEKRRAERAIARALAPSRDDENDADRATG